MGRTRVTDLLTAPLWARTHYHTHYPSQTHPLPLLLTHAKLLRPSNRGLPCRIPSLPAANCGPSLPLVLLHTAAPLSHAAARRCCTRRDAMAKRLPPRVPRSPPYWLLCTCVARPPPTPPPPVVPCSPATSCVPARPFAVWCTLFYRMVPRHSLPLKRGADSCITPKRVASRQVAATMLESPRCQTCVWKPPLCRALH
jgi:hypothetical protein